jgi:photosystem II stability/assembly factor-like uncharacterized protein
MWKIKEGVTPHKYNGKNAEKELTILRDLVVHNKPSEIIIVGTNNIMRSTDGGQTWA